MKYRVKAEMDKITETRNKNVPIIKNHIINSFRSF